MELKFKVHSIKLYDNFSCATVKMIALKDDRLSHEFISEISLHLKNADTANVFDKDQIVDICINTETSVT